MKLLNGSDLSGYIKERQAQAVRRLVGTRGITPKLAIVQCLDDPVINTYVRLKKEYGADIGVEVEPSFVDQADIATHLEKLNTDLSIHGIIVQLPLPDPLQTEAVVNMVLPQKDVDALGTKASYDPATPTAILWLLNGYNIDLASKKIVLVGRGKLVGAPLEKMLLASEYEVEVVDRSTENLAEAIKNADVVITATGSPAVVTADMLKLGAVVVDAGVASESGKTVGDLGEDVYSRDDLTLTPQKGGVGPLTVCALFENVIRAANEQQV
jgi:methylenetetrahydrofolate dehydrogenase (NADP+) / methenyltetrahydrofolate cyclohydrolase